MTTARTFRILLNSLQNKKFLATSLITIMTVPVYAQDVKAECSIHLPGIHFTSCLNDGGKNSNVRGTSLRVASGAQKDYFNDPNGKLSNSTAPVLLTEIDNSKPFTFSAKVTPEFKDTYDAGALYLFVSNQLWQKFAFERDENGVTRIVSVRTIETSDDNNHQSSSGKSVYLKISSDTKTVGLYFSSDNRHWNLARLYKNSYPAQVWLGLSSQSPIGAGNSTVFDDVTLHNEAVKNFRTGQ